MTLGGNSSEQASIRLTLKYTATSRVGSQMLLTALCLPVSDSEAHHSTVTGPQETLRDHREAKSEQQHTKFEQQHY